MIQQEIWLPIPEFDGYRASSLGRIKGRRGVLKQYIIDEDKGYWHVKCRKWEGRYGHYRVNRLVTMAFHGAPPTDKHQSAHLDGNKDNNRPDNLEWKTPLDNVHDRFRHGTMLAGPTHPSSKLNLNQVTDIRRRYVSHMSDRRDAGFERPKRGFISGMAKEYDIGISAMLDVVRGRTWADPFYGDSVEQRFNMRERMRVASRKCRFNKAQRKQESLAA